MIAPLVVQILYGVLIGVWAFLFTGPLSESGQVFGWLKRLIYANGKTPEWLYLPLIGCAKCNAFWWAVLLWVSGIGVKVHLFPALYIDIDPPAFYAPVFIMAVFTAHVLEKHNV